MKHIIELFKTNGIAVAAILTLATGSVQAANPADVADAKKQAVEDEIANIKSDMQKSYDAPNWQLRNAAKNDVGSAFGSLLQLIEEFAESVNDYRDWWKSGVAPAGYTEDRYNGDLKKFKDELRWIDKWLNLNPPMPMGDPQPIIYGTLGMMIPLGGDPYDSMTEEEYYEEELLTEPI